jgi:hypothetical protein
MFQLDVGPAGMVFGRFGQLVKRPSAVPLAVYAAGRHGQPGCAVRTRAITRSSASL